MSKKKHKKKNIGTSRAILEYRQKSKKQINKEFKKALDEIEDLRVSMYEADKRDADRRARRKINHDEAEFYTKLESVKTRKKISKKWKKTGFMDHIISLLNEISPLVKLLAKSIASLITLFLSIPFIKRHISPKMVEKISYVFDFAMSM